MNISPEYAIARSSFPIPDSHAALEQSVRLIQGENDPFMSHIPEVRLQDRIRRIVVPTFEALTVVEQMKPMFTMFHITSFADGALAVVQEKDKHLEPERKFPRAIAELNEIKIGKETLLRVLHAISATLSVHNDEKAPFDKNNSRKEVMQAALVLSAEACRAELEHEDAYLCSRIVAQIAKDLPIEFHKVQYQS